MRELPEGNASQEDKRLARLGAELCAVVLFPVGFWGAYGAYQIHQGYVLSGATKLSIAITCYAALICCCVWTCLPVLPNTEESRAGEIKSLMKGPANV